MPIRGQQGLSSAAGAEGPAIRSGLTPETFSPGGVPVLSHLGILDTSQGLDHAHSGAFQAGQLDRLGARVAPSGLEAVNASLDLSFPLPFTSSIGSSSAASLR